MTIPLPLTTSTYEKIQILESLQKEPHQHKDSLIQHIFKSDYKLAVAISEIENDSNYMVKINRDADTFYLIEQNERSVHNLRLKYIEEDIAFQILQYSYTCKHIYLDDFLEGFSISRSTYFRKLKKIKSALLPYDLEIAANGILSGDEIAIRSYFVDLFLYTYNGIDWPFQNITFEATQKISQAINKNMDNMLTPLDEQVYSYWLGVNIERVLLGKTLQKKSTLLQVSFSYDTVHKRRMQYPIKFASLFIYLKKVALFHNIKLSDDTFSTEITLLLIISQGICSSVRHDYRLKSMTFLIYCVDPSINNLSEIWIRLFEKEFHFEFPNDAYALLKKDIMIIHSMYGNIKGQGTFPIEEESIISLINTHNNDIYKKFLYFYTQLKIYDDIKALIEQNEAIIYRRYLLLLLNYMRYIPRKEYVSILMANGKADELKLLETLPRDLHAAINIIPYNPDLTTIVLVDQPYLSVKAVPSNIKVIVTRNMQRSDWYDILLSR